MYLAKMNAQYFMLMDFYMEILAEFNIVVNYHYRNSYNNYAYVVDKIKANLCTSVTHSSAT